MENENSKKAWWKDPITLATVVIAIATVINVAAAILVSVNTAEYTEITHQIYKASSRPYIGISSIDVNSKDDRHILIHVNYKNFGTVPACNVRVNYDLLADGYQGHRSDADVYDSHSNLFPQVTNSIRLRVGTGYDDIMNGKIILDVVVNIKYQGITSDTYELNERWRYYPIHNHFHHVDAYTK